MLRVSVRFGTLSSAHHLLYMPWNDSYRDVHLHTSGIPRLRLPEGSAMDGSLTPISDGGGSGEYSPSPALSDGSVGLYGEVFYPSPQNTSLSPTSPFLHTPLRMLDHFHIHDATLPNMETYGTDPSSECFYGGQYSASSPHGYNPAVGSLSPISSARSLPDSGAPKLPLSNNRDVEDLGALAVLHDSEEHAGTSLLLSSGSLSEPFRTPYISLRRSFTASRAEIAAMTSRDNLLVPQAVPRRNSSHNPQRISVNFFAADHEPEGSVATSERSFISLPSTPEVTADEATAVVNPVVASQANIHAANRRRKNAARFPCKWCSSSFTANHNRINHENAHFGIKPFSCQRCGRAFTTNGTMKRHVRTCKSHLEVA
ncbi:hypothetical protein B0H10DRAFT_2023548 [Mycena sp. CBHHK59/15]|nr:hypothetical protein B0H10DRAFT_2023548 [Mycena sp. CBHHK59/15]